jgi:Cu+-exporting ATPase
MKTFLSIALLVLIATGCKNNTNPEVKTVEIGTSSVKKELDPNATYAKTQFTVSGMTCAIGCAASIEKKIATMEGVKFAKVDFDKKLAMVEYDVAKVTPANLETTVTKIANIYTVSNMETVTAFHKNTSNGDSKKVCEPGCKKECCANHIPTEKKIVCKPDCKEACCLKKSV